MKKVKRDQLRGNYAEHYVATFLSETCLIRQVSSGTDIGIDLYCEAIENEIPYKHFWVQVKAINNSKIKNKNGIKIAKYSFKKSDLEYWAKQPIPVYAFLVPVLDWPPADPEIVFGIRLSEYIIRNGIPEQGHITLSTENGFEKDTRTKDLINFIRKIVSWDSAIILLDKGIIAPVGIDEDKNNSYIYPAGIGSNYIDNVMRNLYDSSVWIGLENIESFNNLSERNKNDLVLLSGFIQLFHRKNFHMLGLEYLLKFAKIVNEPNIAIQSKIHAEKLVSISEDLSEKEKEKLLYEIQNIYSSIIEK